MTGLGARCSQKFDPADYANVTMVENALRRSRSADDVKGVTIIIGRNMNVHELNCTNSGL